MRLKLIGFFILYAIFFAPNLVHAEGGLLDRPVWPTIPSIQAKVLILEYHSIGPIPNNAKWPDLYVKQATFDKQIKILQDLGLKSISFIDAIDNLKAGNFDCTNVVLTFDDGYLDNFTVGEKLNRINFGATFYIPTAFPGKKFDDKGITYMSWNDIKKLDSIGFEIGSHTVNHIDLALASDTSIQFEVSQSKVDLNKQLSKIPKTFSIPLGAYTTGVIGEIEKYKFEGCVTSNRGLMDIEHIQKAPRIKIMENTDLINVITSYIRGNLKYKEEYKYGDNDSRIRSFRTILTRLGYPLQDSEKFDEPMMQAVIAFQKQFNLYPNGHLNHTTIDRMISDFVDLVASNS